MEQRKSVIILGSTGSVGRQALDIAGAEGLRVLALAAGSDHVTIEKQARRFKPEICALDDEKAAKMLKTALSDTDIKVLSGREGILKIISELPADVIINAITGAAGLFPTLEAVKTGRRLALANKESLVMAGGFIMAEARACGSEILPVDSEHNTIFRCLAGRDRHNIKKIILTASGGPFFGYTRQMLKNITVEQALTHPTWVMGKRITVDSATLMNKGFEVIEASHLFGVGPDRIEVIIHRESIIHSLVEYFDNSIIAGLSVPDMRLCVQYAVNYPEIKPAVIEQLDWAEVSRLTFARPDTEAFPLLSAAYDSLAEGGAMPAVLNAADEEAVSAFLLGKIGFSDIPAIVLETLGHFSGRAASGSIEEILHFDVLAREFAKRILNRAKGG
ncbi:MAG TPA: 1-deoxy-D-xylulose-5-phosphate reductoisomerase [Clostridiales bacterium]|nr:1-deoxy-D-xylulose-5-phosphate reductoisomerase [Clostridiales bacterium]